MVPEALIGRGPWPYTRSILGEKLVYSGQKQGVASELRVSEKQFIFLYRAPRTPLFGERASLLDRYRKPVTATGQFDGLISLGEMRDRLDRGVLPIATLER